MRDPLPSPPCKEGECHRWAKRWEEKAQSAAGQLELRPTAPTLVEHFDDAGAERDRLSEQFLIAYVA